MLPCLAAASALEREMRAVDAAPVVRAKEQSKVKWPFQTGLDHIHPPATGL